MYLFIAFIVLQSIAGERLQPMGLDTHGLYPARTIVFVAGIAVFFLWVNLDYDWAAFGQARVFDPILPDGSGFDWVLVCFRLMGLVLVVPVMDELFWRFW